VRERGKMFGIRNPFSKPIQSWHVELIEFLAKTLKPNVYLEIGIYEGETFNKVQALHKIAVDIRAESLEYVENAENITKIHGDSNDTSKFLLNIDKKVDLAFIDADHQANSVIQDFINIETFMSVKGIVLFHDTYPGTLEFSSPQYCGDGFLAIPKLRSLFPDWNFVTLPMHPGLTIASRTDALPDWYRNV
jgi:predicted O-methyltransferase YrrM